MGFVVRKATEQTALALTSDLSAYGERARWSGIYYRGEKIGFSVSQVSERPGGGFKLEETGQMQITLMGAPVASKLHTEVNVDPQYLLQDFKFSLDPGTDPVSIAGTLETPTRIAITVSSTGSSRARMIELKDPPVLGLNLPKRLLALGLSEGAVHELELFDPATLSNGKARIEIGKRELIRIMDRPLPAFRMSVKYAGITTTSWITEVGDIVKEESAIGMVVQRESRERATAIAMSSEVRTDMIEAAAIEPSTRQPIVEPASLVKLRLRFSGADLPGDPSEMNGAGQTTRGDVVEIVDAKTLRAAAPAAELDAFLRPEPFLESDAPEIIAETEKALRQLPPAAGAREKAEALVRYVNFAIDKKPTMSVPSAAEVLRTKVGDCNEHTALYVAMARAAKIPARVAIGLVNLRGAFYYHAWPEVFVGEANAPAGSRNGTWIPVDPTFNQFPADVTHVRLARGGFDKQAAILPLLGRAKIEVLEMVDGPDEPNSRPLVGASTTDAPALTIDLPPPSSKDSCWKRPSGR